MTQGSPSYLLQSRFLNAQQIFGDNQTQGDAIIALLDIQQGWLRSWKRAAAFEMNEVLSEKRLLRRYDNAFLSDVSDVITVISQGSIRIERL